MSGPILHSKWIEAARRGDTGAMEKIYLMYHRAMFNTAYRITGDYHYAEDIMQEAFIKAFDKISDFRGDAQLGAWIKRIVINESLRWLRRYGKFETDTPLPEKDLSADDDPDEPFRSTEDTRRLMEALISLRPNYRTVLNLHYIEGYDLKETARIMGISYANVRTMLTRAKQQLKKILENEKR